MATHYGNADVDMSCANGLVRGTLRISEHIISPLSVSRYNCTVRTEISNEKETTGGSTVVIATVETTPELVYYIDALAMAAGDGECAVVRRSVRAMNHLGTVTVTPIDHTVSADSGLADCTMTEAVDGESIAISVGQAAATWTVVLTVTASSAN